MSRYRNEISECKVYIGDLPRNADEKEIERSFEHYGSLKSVWVARNPPGFAFVEFEDPRDAQDAVRGLDGSTLCGARVRVEHATGKSRPKNFSTFGSSKRDPPHRSRDSPRRNYSSPGDRCYICGDFGHASYDCPRSSSGRGKDYSNGRDCRRGGSGSRRRSPSPAWKGSRNRSRSRSYSRSPVRSRRSRSRN